MTTQYYLNLDSNGVLSINTYPLAGATGTSFVDLDSEYQKFLLSDIENFTCKSLYCTVEKAREETASPLLGNDESNNEKWLKHYKESIFKYHFT